MSVEQTALLSMGIYNFQIERTEQDKRIKLRLKIKSKIDSSIFCILYFDP